MYSPMLQHLLYACADFALGTKMDGIEVTYTISILGEIHIRVDNYLPI